MKIKKNGGIVSEKVGDELILFDTEKLSFYRLNHVGADIWRYVNNIDMYELMQKMGKKYKIDIKVLEKDINAYISKLHKEGLIRISE